ncbi:glycosyltransferase family 2 protein [Geobacter sp. AOG1]|uniref:glycosyltransferase family 2 protein n=1 Tax=Geobacter sp. AOG1 TaxID=1566346 RepID=UPI001CC36322|nr:glycosyltransferase family 2 protein [Geobacter sp. AOG1]GFE58584.1 glycosyl transferase family 2 [Geobacter sp. AOG1]
MLDCTASIVVYNNRPDMLRRAVESILSCSLDIELHIVDNSPTQELKHYVNDLPVKYHFYGCNAGYGRGHNKAIQECSESRYHVVINPDVIAPSTAIESLFSFMDQNPDIGIVCPKILNEDGTIQFLNKRYPNVFDLVARRFIPQAMHRFVRRRLDRYEMKDVGYEEICEVEFLSGSFMFCRTEALEAVGGFDDRYFMYLEDADLSRKIQQAGYRTVYYPKTAITHLWERASYKSMEMTLVHIRSAIVYFNKWGWKFF